jgi:hypothetical protein
MDQLSERPVDRPMTDEVEPKTALVSMGAGVIFPHVDRHLRGQRPDGQTKTTPVAPTRVSMGAGIVFPAVAVHVKRTRATGR